MLYYRFQGNIGLSVFCSFFKDALFKNTDFSSKSYVMNVSTNVVVKFFFQKW